MGRIPPHRRGPRSRRSCAIGRDPLTPGLVDRAWLLTRPQFTWHPNLERVRFLVTDADFTQRVDEAARAVLGRPADSLVLLGRAISYHVGYDVEMLKYFLKQKAGGDAKPVATIRGRVVDAGDGGPIAGAIVYTPDAIARTDDSGAFRLEPPSPRAWG